MKNLTDGKSIKYMRDRDLISVSDVQEAFNKGLFKEKDRIYLKQKGIITEEAAAQNP